MIIQFEISDKAFEILKDIDEAGSAEFRDSEFDSLESFKNSKCFNPEIEGFQTEKWFKARNFCDLKDIEDLVNRNLIDSDSMSWHITYVVTDFGKEVLGK